MFGGDWYIYSVTVENKGNTNLYDITLNDVFPNDAQGQVTMFWYEPQIVAGTLSYSPALPNATSISWSIPYLAYGSSVTVYLFVKYEDALTGASGANICNTGQVDVVGDATDTDE